MRTISDERKATSVVQKILLQVKPRIPLARNLSDERYFWLVAKLSRGLRPWLEPGIKQDAAISREAFEGPRALGVAMAGAVHL